MEVMILAGGKGTRLWPYSRTSFPKQFLSFEGGSSLLQKTIVRLLPLVSTSSLWIVTCKEYEHLVRHQAMQVAPELEDQIIVEPFQKNTAPALVLGLSYLLKEKGVDPCGSLLVCSADHHLVEEEAFRSAVRRGSSETLKGKHLLFGVIPTSAETGYGYIKASKLEGSFFYEVEEFVEKPSLTMAQEYLLSGLYFWNAGIFLFHIATLVEELKSHCPEMYSALHLSYSECRALFIEFPALPIDIALIEKSKKVVMLPLQGNWSDVGSWDAVYALLPKDEEKNASIGNVAILETQGCLIFGGKRLIATAGLENLLIIDTEDALLIAKRGKSQLVKPLMERVKDFVEYHPVTYRPWGRFTVLEEGERYKIKKIEVAPQKTLSVQKHHHRSEHWVVIKGVAKVMKGEEESFLHENESIFIPKGQIHCLENPGSIPLELIEVQVGEYVGEDDIMRLDHLYERIR